MLEPAVLVAILVTLLAGNAIARVLRLPAPVVLMAAGSALSLVPTLGDVRLPSQWVLLIFLPLLLYWESINVSTRQFRRMARVILLSGTVLVVVTAGAIAAALHALGLGWAEAWIIGAALGPTDATAVAGVSKGMPQSMAAVLQAESLINDGTALVVYGLAVGTATGTIEPSVSTGAGRLAVSLVGGILAGLVTGWCWQQVARRLTDPLLANLGSITAPFIAFLAAEEVGASGILAVVVAGLYATVASPLVVAARARLQGAAFWSLTTFVLNGVLFLLLGAELPKASQGLRTDTLQHALLLVAAAWATMILTRYVFGNVITGIIRTLDRRAVQRTRRSTHRARILNTVSCLRGAVSLAVALSVPEGLAGRDLIVFVTGTVVAVSLTVQGLALPSVIRWADLAQDNNMSEELRQARLALARTALDALPDAADRHGVRPELAAQLQARFSAKVDALDSDEDRERVVEAAATYRAFMLDLTRRQRETALDLRRRGKIDNTTFRALQAQLDADVVRIQGPVSPAG